MAKILIPRTRKGFSMIENELREVSVSVYFIDFKESANNKLIVSHCGNEYHVSIDNFYASVNDFRINSHVLFDVNYYLSNRDNRFEISDTGDYFIYYTFEDGEPVEHKKEFSTISLNFNENGAVVNVEIDGLPNVCYRTREECLSTNDVVIVDKEGISNVKHGATKLSTLTDEQISVVEELGKMLKKAESLGVIFFTEYTEIYAINAKALSDDGRKIEVGYECDIDDRDKAEVIYFRKHSHKVGSLFSYLNEEEDVFAFS